MLVASGVLVSAQAIQLPSAPLKQFGASISPAYEGWFDNPDGTHSFLIGYYSRNTSAEVDVPIGPANKFEPGNPDMGQPTHFLTRRRYGMFVVTVPKDFPKTQRISWTLTANGVTTTIPFHMHTDYNISPLKGSEESPDGTYNEPPMLKFEASGQSFAGPFGTPLNAKTTLSRTAVVGTPMPIDIFADDDARTSGGGGGGRGNNPPVTVSITKYRGPGEVKVEPIKLEILKGGKPMEQFSGKGSTTATFSEPGDYVLTVIGNDLSGNGGGGAGCCWTNAFMKVAVKAK